jgi:hypothetical protein
VLRKDGWVGTLELDHSLLKISIDAREERKGTDLGTVLVLVVQLRIYRHQEGRQWMR